jgi:hypothetical protein
LGFWGHGMGLKGFTRRRRGAEQELRQARMDTDGHDYLRAGKGWICEGGLDRLGDGEWK